MHRKKVIKLKDECSVWLTQVPIIAQKFVTDFTAQFTSEHCSPRNLPPLGLPTLLTDINNQSLIALLDPEDVRFAFFSMDSNKTPGPNGFGPGFFKTFWPVITDDLFASVIEFFQHRRLIKVINHTFITLIPKSNSPSQTGHYRPISLCSIVYKVISKILTNRLRPLLDKLISPLQSAFIFGRSIHDNVLLTHEVMHKFKNNKLKQA